MKILVMGLPGSGKTTQAKKISQQLGLCFVKAGDILREMALSGSPQGQTIKQALEKGELVDDQIVAEVVKNKLTADDCQNGFVMDGYPRSLSQLTLLNPNFDQAFYLKVDIDRLKERLLARGRADDTAQLIDKRLSIQKKETHLILEYFKKNHQLVEIDGGKSEDQVFEQIMSFLK